MAELLEGEARCRQHGASIYARASRRSSAARRSCLRCAFVRVGQRPDDLSYERTARKRAWNRSASPSRPYRVGRVRPKRPSRRPSTRVNRDENVHGCLLFRPLPSFVDGSRTVCKLLDPEEGYRRHHAGIAGPRCSPMATRGIPARDGGRVHPAARSLPGAALQGNTSWWWDAASSWASPCP